MADHWEWLRAQFEPPAKRFSKAPAGSAQPLKKTHLVKILPNITGLRTDEQLQEFLQRHKKDTVLINFGSSWCSHCHQMFPAFLRLSHQFPKLQYAVAQVDYLGDASVAGITYTPTFAVYKQGRKVDLFFGANEQQLRDHIWLHSQTVPPPLQQ